MACDAANTDWCIFTLTDSAPPNDVDTDDWQSLGAVEHGGLDQSPCGHGQGGFYCEVQDLNGNTLSISPKPWKNGDNLVATGTEHTGNEWTKAN